MSDVDILMTESSMRLRKFIEGAFTQFEDQPFNRALEVPTAYLNVLRAAIV